jgi:hypothetical protein
MNSLPVDCALKLGRPRSRKFLLRMTRNGTENSNEKYEVCGAFHGIYLCDPSDLLTCNFPDTFGLVYFDDPDKRNVCCYLVHSYRLLNDYKSPSKGINQANCIMLTNVDQQQNASCRKEKAQ